MPLRHTQVLLFFLFGFVGLGDFKEHVGFHTSESASGPVGLGGRPWLPWESTYGQALLAKSSTGWGAWGRLC